MSADIINLNGSIVVLSEMKPLFVGCGIVAVSGVKHRKHDMMALAAINEQIMAQYYWRRI